VIVKLTNAEMTIATILGTMRQSVNQAANVKDQSYSDDSEKNHLVGAIAEIAWNKRYETFPDFNCEPRRGGWDAITDGKKVDIKATDLKDGNLVTSIGKLTDAVDRYVLAIVKDVNTVEFIGWIDSKDFLRDENKTDLGHGKTYFLHRSKLHPFTRTKVA